MSAPPDPPGTAREKSTNVVWQQSPVAPPEREARLGQKGAVVWFTGLSGSGKSTLARGVERRLFDQGYFPVLLDGDNVRHGLCGDLGFSEEDRRENIRRVGELACIMARYGVVVLAAFISPYQDDRERVRKQLAEGRFLEVHVHAPLGVCEERDVKGLYKKARSGDIKNFTGIDAPYEAPATAELTVPTHELSVEQSVKRVFELLKARGLLDEGMGGPA